MQRNCILLYMIIVFREGSQTRFELLRTQWNLLAFQCDVGCNPLSACLWHAKKAIINAWIVNRLSWATTSRLLETLGRFPRKHLSSFLCKRVWNFTKKGLYDRCFLPWKIFENGWLFTAWDVYFLSILTTTISFNCYYL